MRGVPANGQSMLQARLNRRLTQDQLSFEAGLDVKTVRSAEQGKRLDVETLARLAAVLGMELSEAIRDPVENNFDGRKQVVREWLFAWDRQDITALVACYHPEAVLCLPGEPFIPFSGEHRGLVEIQRIYEIAWQTAKTAPDEAGDYRLMDCEEAVILQGYKGVNSPDGKLHKLSCVQIFKFESLLILEHHVEYDTLAMHKLLQL